MHLAESQKPVQSEASHACHLQSRTYILTASSNLKVYKGRSARLTKLIPVLLLACRVGGMPLLKLLPAAALGLEVASAGPHRAASHGAPFRAPWGQKPPTSVSGAERCREEKTE